MCVKYLVSPLLLLGRLLLAWGLQVGWGFNDTDAASIHETIVAHTHTCIFQYKHIQSHTFRLLNLAICLVNGKYNLLCTVTSLVL